MIRLNPELAEKFLKTVHYLEGGNVERVEFILSGVDENGEFMHYVEIYAYPEGKTVSCKIRLNQIKAFRFDAPCSSNYFGLAGYPNSLDIVWSNDCKKVILAIGASVTEITYDALRDSSFWVEAESIDVEVFGA